MPTIQFENYCIEYTLIRKPKLKNISIKLNKNRTVTVTSPNSISQDQLDKLLYKKAPWILKKWAELADMPAMPDRKQFTENEMFLYLGSSYPLALLNSDAYPVKKSKHNKFILHFQNGVFTIIEPTELPQNQRIEILATLFKQWYIQQGQNFLVDRLSLYTKTMDVSPAKVVFKEQKRRWGTCTGKRSIYLNWRLLMAPISIIDYVLVHELAHLRHPNHSKEFWSFVALILPDYKERKLWLKKNGGLLTI